MMHQPTYQLHNRQRIQCKEIAQSGFSNINGIISVNVGMADRGLVEAWRTDYEQAACILPKVRAHQLRSSYV